MAHGRAVAGRDVPARRGPGDGGRAAAGAGPLRAGGRGAPARGRGGIRGAGRAPSGALRAHRRARGPPRRCTRDVLAAVRAGAISVSVLAATEDQPRARIALEAGAARPGRALARLSVPRAAGQRQARRGARVRGGADRARLRRSRRRRAARAVGRASRPRLGRAARRARDPRRRRARADRAAGGAAAVRGRACGCS